MCFAVAEEIIEQDGRKHPPSETAQSGGSPQRRRLHRRSCVTSKRGRVTIRARLPLLS